MIEGEAAMLDGAAGTGRVVAVERGAGECQGVAVPDRPAVVAGVPVGDRDGVHREAGAGRHHDGAVGAPRVDREAVLQERRVDRDGLVRDRELPHGEGEGPPTEAGDETHPPTVAAVADRLAEGARRCRQAVLVGGGGDEDWRERLYRPEISEDRPPEVAVFQP